LRLLGRNKYADEQQDGNRGRKASKAHVLSPLLRDRI
jgi:hypothetical protein